jgi:hypothetical protein
MPKTLEIISAIATLFFIVMLIAGLTYAGNNQKEKYKGHDVEKKLKVKDKEGKDFTIYFLNDTDTLGRQLKVVTHAT